LKTKNFGQITVIKNYKKKHNFIGKFINKIV